MKGERRRHAPRRTCVQCGAEGEKGSFLRIAGRPETGWEPDPESRLPGRGIYICRRQACVEGFVKRIRTAKGGTRWGLGPRGAVLAERVAAWWAQAATP